MKINSKKSKKLVVSLLTAVIAFNAVISCSQVGIGIPESEKPAVVLHANAAGGRAFNQYHSQWQAYTYTKWAQSGNSLYSSGCMLFSFGNAIHSLTSRVVNITDLADWACGNGSWRPGAGGGYRETFYNQIEAAYGRVYQFTIKGRYYSTVEDTKLINHLLNGGVATVHVPGHFMAITDYNPDEHTYRVIESAVSSSRGLPASSWVSASKLKAGQTKVDWFCLLSRSENSTSNQDQPQISQEGNSSVRYFPKYTGSSESFAAALYVIGSDGSYAYREKIAAANGISGYLGTLEQNKLLFQLLKAGLLIKPDTEPDLSEIYFPKYTGSEETLILALHAIGVDNSYSYRARIAVANDIAGYCGTAAQNIQMLELLRAGKLLKP